MGWKVLNRLNSLPGVGTFPLYRIPFCELSFFLTSIPLHHFLFLSSEGIGWGAYRRSWYLSSQVLDSQGLASCALSFVDLGSRCLGSLGSLASWRLAGAHCSCSTFEWNASLLPKWQHNVCFAGRHCRRKVAMKSVPEDADPRQAYQAPEPSSRLLG